jgi:hypothetical protein
MKNLNEKLFWTSVLFGVILVALIFFFGIKGLTPIPLWGLISLIFAGSMMTSSLLLFIARKLAGAQDY